jgi:hypothetical protein
VGALRPITAEVLQLRLHSTNDEQRVPASSHLSTVQPNDSNIETIAVKYDMADSALRLAENITLLRKTHDKPVPPTRNDLPLTSSNDGRTLSFQNELNILQCLSYLSTYSDHPGLVMAMCVEEAPGNQRLIVTIATNNDNVTNLKRGVRGIVEILEKQAHGSAIIRNDYDPVKLTIVRS